MMSVPGLDAPPPAGPRPVQLKYRSWGYLASAAPNLVVACGLVTLLIQDPTPWWAWVLVLTSTTGAALHLLALRRARRTYWLVNIGAAGVRWNDTGFEMGWSEVAEVRIFVARRWRRFFPYLDRVVLITPAEASFARRAGFRPIGRSIMLSRVAATPQQIVDGIARFTDVPVH